MVLELAPCMLKSCNVFDIQRAPGLSQALHGSGVLGEVGKLFYHALHGLLQPREDVLDRFEALTHPLAALQHLYLPEDVQRRPHGQVAAENGPHDGRLRLLLPRAGYLGLWDFGALLQADRGDLGSFRCGCICIGVKPASGALLLQALFPVGGGDGRPCSTMGGPPPLAFTSSSPGLRGDQEVGFL